MTLLYHTNRESNLIVLEMNPQNVIMLYTYIESNLIIYLSKACLSNLLADVNWFYNVKLCPIIIISIRGLKSLNN